MTNGKCKWKNEKTFWQYHTKNYLQFSILSKTNQHKAANHIEPTKITKLGVQSISLKRYLLSKQAYVLYSHLITLGKYISPSHYGSNQYKRGQKRKKFSK